MQPNIFLSHTHSDKPVVEPIALRLRDIFGQENVFYDAWSIQPGDGIIQKMNEGLASPDFVFFFVSDSSLKSKMVEIEWQNSLYASTKGKVRIVPVRVDGSPMPPIMMQNVWIDLHAQGIEVAIQQIVNVVQGQNTFTPQHLRFSNLTFTTTLLDADSLRIEIAASHLMEPNPNFAIVTPCTNYQMKVEFEDGSPSRGGFNQGVASVGGSRRNAFMIAPLGGAITPKRPMRIKLTKLSDKQIVIDDVMHEAGLGEWVQVPRKH